MALSINGEIFYNQIFPKLIFDKELGKYKLNLTAYIPLNLNRRQTELLEKVCIRNNIIMEKLPEKITVQEAEELFKKMKILKEELEQTIDYKIKKQKEKEYYEIRTKIFEGHQKIIYKLIMDICPNLESSQLKDDIIQSCYECLIKAIDNYDIEKGEQTFRWYLRFYVSKHMLRIITHIEKDGYNKELLEIIEIREELQTKDNTVDISKIATLSGLTEERIKELLRLEQMLTSISIEELKEDEDCILESSIDLEETTNLEILRKLLILLIDTLPNETQKEVIKLYYGFEGNIPYKICKIAKLLNISSQRTDQHRSLGIELLTHPARLKYIKELYTAYTDKEIPKEQIEIDEFELVYEKLEKYLFRLLFQKEELISLINNIKPKYRNVLLIHFELTDDVFSDFEEKINKSNLSPATYTKRKKEGLSILRTTFKEIYIDPQPNEDIKTVLDYLMYSYLNKSNNKSKKGIKNKNR